MSARDANNATWYLLRYPEDFDPRHPIAAARRYPPHLDATLFYDDVRHVLELLPKRVEGELKPLPGVAVDVSGEVYRVDPVSGELRVRRCDGSEGVLVCEPHILARPAGLALDRRGFLYVADPPAQRVVVLLPEDGSVRAVLDGGLLQEPVDVAVSPAGRIYVADRAAGRVVMYSARHARAGAFPARNPENLPATPRPFAVMIDADRTVLVADAGHPRLLRFDPEGKPLADVPLTPLVKALEGGDVPLGALEKVYGKRLPRFLVGACALPLPARDGGIRLAEVHRALRLLALRLAHALETTGTFVSTVLDSGTPGTVWHRVEVEADLPEGTGLTVETATADDAARLDPPAAAPWQAPRDRDSRVVPVTAAIPDQLVQSPPGRYLRLRVALYSDGRETPSLHSVRVLYPRVSYLDLLPRVYRRDPGGAHFLEHFLALFERVFTAIENRYETFAHELNPDAAPRAVIDWLACLIDLSFDPSWPVERRRALVAAALDLYRRRGTPGGIERYVEIYTGISPVVQEAFLRRPARPALLGSRGSVLGCSLALAPAVPDTRPDEQLYRDYAHRFTVLVYLDDCCDREVVLPVVDRIVAVNKPAHTSHAVCTVYPEARVGLQSTLGLDFVVGGREAPRAPLGGCPEPGAPQEGASTLGVDAVLGERRPQYARPFIPTLL
jgi:phage tail-like protein